MSDDFLELDNDLDAIETAREGVSTSEQATGRQPKINLNDIPEFKEWQSVTDRRQAALQAQAQQQQQQAQALEQELHRIRMQGMDETQQLQYELELTRKGWQEERNLREQERMAIQRQRDLEDISLATGMPIQQLYEYPTNIHVHELWRLATKWQVEQKPTRRGAPIEEPDDFQTATPNDTVDLAPSGGGNSVTQRFQAAYDKHRKLYNMDKLLEIEAEATRRGIRLNEW